MRERRNFAAIPPEADKLVALSLVKEQREDGYFVMWKVDGVTAQIYGPFPLEKHADLVMRELQKVVQRAVTKRKKKAH